MTRCRALLAVVVLATAGTTSASGRDERSASQEQAPKASAKKVVRQEELKVEGKAERPKAIKVMPPDEAQRARKDDMLPRILDEVERGPF